MLVLTRRSGEAIRVGETTVTVVRLGGGKVRLGIEAAADVPVQRMELRPGGLAGPALPAGPARGEGS